MKKTILSLLVLLGLMMGAKAQDNIPLTFEAIAAGTVTLEKEGDFTPNSEVQYRIGETGDWSSYLYGTGISLQAGQKLQFCSTSSAAYAQNDSEYSHFTCTADCYLYGNLGSLFNYDNSVPGSGCEKMFYGNTHIKNRTGNSLVLPATSLGGNCYREMFSGCTALTAAPALPATSLSNECYRAMFSGCTALTEAPALPATSLARFCYYEMFSGCTALTAAPALPATGLEYECYMSMFSGCTALTEAPTLPATSLVISCYDHMFSGCTALTEAPALPATSLVISCYDHMFSGCTALTEAPALPATSLAEYCYYHMFSGCTTLTEAPALPATSLDQHCYDHMFSGCTALTEAPALPANSLAVHCYQGMFLGCTALTEAPTLPASTLVTACYSYMFNGCTNLNYVRCLATDISAKYCTSEWLSGVASAGTFVKFTGMEHWTTGDSGIPAGWTVEDHNPFINPLTFQAVEAGTITVKLDEGANLDPIQYRLNGGAWTNVAWNTPIALSTDDVIRFRGNNGTCCDYVSIEGIWQPAGFHFECSNPCYVYGNMMSLIDQDNFATNTILTETHAFYRLFKRGDFESNTTILNHPSLDIVLPATTLTAKCYLGLFANCQGITRAPVLPATTMQEDCYFEMFRECASLATAPVLPATTLEDYCYNSMFAECTSLTAAPELPATELKRYCYSDMFNSCTSLTTAPALPATTLAQSCYNGMFKACTNLTTAPELPATVLYEYCYHYMFNGCTKLTTAPAVLPADTLKSNCYSGMFIDCKKLTTAPALPATTLDEYCYYRMFEGCKKLTTAPALPATTLVSSCYYDMFYNCSSLNYVVCLATDISASNCTKNWLSSVANSGTFVKDPNMTNWSSGKSGIPSGWNVININKFTTDGDWNVAANWSSNAVPEAGSSVVVAANATIPSGYTANVKYIIINEGKTLTIEDGGQLRHGSATLRVTMKKEIAGYDPAPEVNDGWHFISSPFIGNTVIGTSGDSSHVLNLDEGDYDLYGFYAPGDNGGNEWINYESDPTHEVFSTGNGNNGLVSKRGYLYANASELTVLEFTGTISNSIDNIMTESFAYDAEAGYEFNGWDLVGNPFSANCYLTYVDGEEVLAADFYVLNGNGDGYDLSESGEALPPLTGALINYEATGTVRFSTEAPTGKGTGMLNMTLTQDRGKVDQARVRFGEGYNLKHKSFRANSGKLYMPVEGEDYAVVYAEDQMGEIPVNIKVHKNGEYTLTVSETLNSQLSALNSQLSALNSQLSTLSYLHLIDNLTGADIDLLTTPSYAFTAKTTDYESRFKLVFSAIDNDNENLAFISNGRIILTGVVACDASLQVIDMLGRVISNRTVTPHSSLPTPNSPGVYLLRLLNGNNVQVQKIVVR